MCVCVCVCSEIYTVSFLACLMFIVFLSLPFACAPRLQFNQYSQRGPKIQLAFLVFQKNFGDASNENHVSRKARECRFYYFCCIYAACFQKVNFLDIFSFLVLRYAQLMCILRHMGKLSTQLHFKMCHLFKFSLFLKVTEAKNESLRSSLSPLFYRRCRYE